MDMPENCLPVAGNPNESEECIAVVSHLATTLSSVAIWSVHDRMEVWEYLISRFHHRAVSRETEDRLDTSLVFTSMSS